MHRVAALATLGLALGLAGCGGMGIYCKEEFSANPMAGATLEALFRANGAPDVQGQVGDLRLLGWKGTEAMSFWDKVLTGMPLFGRGTKPTYVALVDAQGKVLTATRGQPGEFLTVLGLTPLPVDVHEVKR